MQSNKEKWKEAIAVTRQNTGDPLADLLAAFIEHRPDSDPKYYDDIESELAGALIRCTSLGQGLPADYSVLQSEADAKRFIGGTRISIESDEIPTSTTSTITVGSANDIPKRQH